MQDHASSRYQEPSNRKTLHNQAVASNADETWSGIDYHNKGTHSRFEYGDTTMRSKVVASNAGHTTDSQKTRQPEPFRGTESDFRLQSDYNSKFDEEFELNTNSVLHKNDDHYRSVSW